MRRALFLSSLLSLCLAVQVAATDPFGSPEIAPVSAFAETIDVRVVHVEAVVTDRDDQRVTGLRAEDFRLLVDGQEVPIDYFTEIRDQHVVASDDATRTTRPASVALEPDQAAPVRYLVFFDEIFTRARDRYLMAGELEKHIDQLGPEDTMTLVVFDGASPEVVIDDSGDPERLRAGLRHIGKGRRMRGGLFKAERDFFAGTPEEFRAVKRADHMGFTGLFGDGYARDTTLHIDRQAQLVLDGLAASMRRLAWVTEPGRRVLLWVSAGWKIQPPITAPDRYGPDGKELPDRKDHLIQAGRLASRLGFTVYPIDAPGWQTNGMRNFDASFGVDSGHRPGSTFQEMEVHATFETFAEITGGQAYVNSFRREALGRVIDDVASYYWMGFDASWGADGSEHTIEVLPRRRDLEVRSRTGIWATPEKQLRELDVQAVRIVSARDYYDGLDIRFGKSWPIGDDRVHVSVELRFPVHTFGALPTDWGAELQLEAHLMTADRDGDSSEPRSWPFRLGAPRVPEPGDNAMYIFEAVFDHDTEDVVVTVHDRLGEAFVHATATFNYAGES